MPVDDCKAVAEELFQEFAGVHLHWRYFHELFGVDESRIDALNERTGEVFGILQRVLMDKLILQIAGLLAWSKVANNHVVSVAGAIDRLPDAGMKAELTKKHLALRTKYKAIIEHRDRQISHNDLAVARGRETMGDVSRQMMKGAIADLHSLSNEVIFALDKSEYGFPPSMEKERVETLLKILRLGNAAIDQERVNRQNQFKKQYGVDIDLPDDPLDD